MILMLSRDLSTSLLNTACKQSWKLPLRLSQSLWGVQRGENTQNIPPPAHKLYAVGLFCNSVTENVFKVQHPGSGEYKHLSKWCSVQRILMTELMQELCALPVLPRSSPSCRNPGRRGREGHLDQGWRERSSRMTRSRLSLSKQGLSGHL